MNRKSHCKYCKNVIDEFNIKYGNYYFCSEKCKEKHIKENHNNYKSDFFIIKKLYEGMFPREIEKKYKITILRIKNLLGYERYNCAV